MTFLIVLAIVALLVLGVFLYIKFGQKKTALDPALPVGEAVVKKEEDASIWNHISSWMEVYWWSPMSLISVLLLAKFSFFLTGRKPLETGIDWPGMGFKIFVCVVIVVLLSITRQATGIWLSKEEQKMHISLAWSQRIKTMFFALLFAYIILH